MNFKAIKTKAIATFIVFLMAFFVGSSAIAATDYLNPDNNGLKASGGELYKTDSSVNGVVGQVITTALSLLGIIFMALMIYGGFLWMTARGDEGQATKAKDLITAAVIGVVIVVGAYAITYFIITKTTAGNLNLSGSAN